MKHISLHQGIFRLVISLVIATSVTILINVWWVTYEQAQQRMSKDIALAQSVLAQTLDNQEALLFTSASVLADDFGFKQAVATADAPTITSALNNHKERISADVMAILSLNGEILASTIQNDIAPTTNQLLNQNSINNIVYQGGISSFMTLNGKIYKIIMLRIDAPTPIAISMVGFEINQAFLNKLESTVHLDVKITAHLPQESITIVNTDRAITENNTHSYSQLEWQHLIFSKNALIAQEFTMYESKALTLKLVLTQTVDKLISEFTTLKTNITIIIIIAAILAFIVAHLYSKRLAAPLKHLSKVAKNISTGNYQQTVDTSSGSHEFTDLALAFEHMQKSIKAREIDIVYQAEHDPLTGLYTRYHVGYLIDEKLHQKERFQVIAVNIVGFRAINDVFGYQDGDLCLVTLANRIAQLGGIAAKFTGGEFLWIPTEPLSMLALTNVKAELERAVVENDVTIPLKLSLACIACPAQSDNAQLVFKRLNILLDEAQLDRTRLLVFEDKFEHKYTRRLKIITQLKKALAANSHDLSLNYQPKLHLSSQKINSVEALIRWNDPGLGFVPPDEFIGIAEQAGVIGDVTNWVITRAIEDAQKMRAEGLDISIAINLSAKDIANPDLLNLIKIALRAADLPDHTLSFEITESDLVEDPQSAKLLLQEFKSQGHLLAIDDFGTGYSSLAYLKSFPIDTLKIDKSFILELSCNKDDRDIVETILQLAEKFGLSVVAEGVEDKASLHILAELGCTWIQGYYICKPINLKALIKWCQKHENSQWIKE